MSTHDEVAYLRQAEQYAVAQKERVERACVLLNQAGPQHKIAKDERGVHGIFLFCGGMVMLAPAVILSLRFWVERAPISWIFVAAVFLYLVIYRISWIIPSRYQTFSRLGNLRRMLPAFGFLAAATFWPVRKRGNWWDYAEDYGNVWVVVVAGVALLCVFYWQSQFLIDHSVDESATDAQQRFRDALWVETHNWEKSYSGVAAAGRVRFRAEIYFAIYAAVCFNFSTLVFPLKNPIPYFALVVGATFLMLLLWLGSVRKWRLHSSAVSGEWRAYSLPILVGLAGSFLLVWNTSLTTSGYQGCLALAAEEGRSAPAGSEGRVGNGEVVTTVQPSAERDGVGKACKELSEMQSAETDSRGSEWAEGVSADAVIFGLQALGVGLTVAIPLLTVRLYNRPARIRTTQNGYRYTDRNGSFLEVDQSRVTISSGEGRSPWYGRTVSTTLIGPSGEKVFWHSCWVPSRRIGQRRYEYSYSVLEIGSRYHLVGLNKGWKYWCVRFVQALNSKQLASPAERCPYKIERSEKAGEEIEAMPQDGLVTLTAYGVIPYIPNWVLDYAAKPQPEVE